MKISVFGLGYVGVVSAACLAKAGHSVIAVDINPSVVEDVAAGRAPLFEKDLAAVLNEVYQAGRLTATLDAAHAVMNTNMSLLCVGTPGRADGTLNLDYMMAACSQIGALLKQKATFHTVVIRSTLLPGSTEKHCRPALEQTSGKKAGAGFGMAVNPEFLREGSAIGDFFAPPKIVVGADDSRTADAVIALYEGINAPRIVTSLAVAESIKYADNSWHALKVGFANELGHILKHAGVDSHAVMEVFCQDEKLNLSRAYLKPGFAFGGSCLPKDVSALRGYAHSLQIDTPLFDGLLAANDAHITRAYDFIRQSGKRDLTFFGLSFKAGTDDLRGSPLLTLARKLTEDGYRLRIIDPAIQATLRADNAQSIAVRRMLGPLTDNIHTDDALPAQQGGLIVIGQPDRGFMRQILSIANDDTPILDLVRLDPSLESRRHYHGICW